MADQSTTAPSVATHGVSSLPEVEVDSYNLELKDDEGLLGDRANNTIVFYISDNGYLYGEHRTSKKMVPYEESVRTPMVVRYTAPITAAHEPNRAGRSSGVVLLDRYIAANYRPAVKFGFYVLLERRSG